MYRQPARSVVVGHNVRRMSADSGCHSGPAAPVDPSSGEDFSTACGKFDSCRGHPDFGAA
jgi:hypothetical protein